MIIGVSGVANSGKDTFARFLVEDHGFVVVSLADPLKRICREVFDFTDEQLWGPSEDRNKPDLRYPTQKCAGCQSCEFRCDHWYYLTPRHALQQLGTNWGRDCYENVWVEYAIRTHERLQAGGWAYDQKRGLFSVSYANEWASPKVNVAIPDVRFRNEIEGIRAAGGKVIRIRRPGAGLSGAAALHPSETEQASIPDEAFDIVVENNGTLEELRAKAAALLAHFRP